MPLEEPGGEFARETGELTAHRWKIGLTVYLIFAALGALVEWQYHPDRGPLLLAANVAQAVVIAVAWIAMRGPSIHPRTAWIVLITNVCVCTILGVYNAAVRGDMLYVLITYLSFMLVSAMFIPWGARFQLGLNCGVIAAYALGVGGGGRVGPVPPYDYIGILANAVLSTLGALYIDQYRRQLFAQASALRDANRGLQEANETRTELLSGLSHDMRTPLAILTGYADILNETPGLAAELQQPVRSIARESRELLYLVDSVLDLARLEAGRLPFQRSTFRLAPVLDALRETTGDLLRDRGVCLNWQIPPALELDSDAGKVREIIRNLLSNAVKYTQQGEISLLATPVGDGVEITVTDTGVGIARENLDLIFRKFGQVDGNPVQPSGGLGFGLYMVKLLVTILGARITVHSAVNAGSTFRVWLPPQPPQA